MNPKCPWNMPERGCLCPTWDKEFFPVGWDSVPELSCGTDAWFRWSRWTLTASSSACTGLLVRSRWRRRSGLQLLSCNAEASRAGDGKAAVHGSAVTRGLGAGCRARKQDRLTVGCLVPSVMWVDSHSCPRVLWWKALLCPMGKVSASFKLPLHCHVTHLQMCGAAGLGEVCLSSLKLN